MNGKGSKRRPLSVSNEEFAKNWSDIFDKKRSSWLSEKEIKRATEKGNIYK
jgi:hypothetical protein